MRTNLSWFCLFVLFISFIAGCASAPTPFTPQLPPEGKAIVYFYYPKGKQLIRYHENIYDNDRHVFILVDGTYVEHIVDPGIHAFRVKSAMFIDEPITFEIKPGEIYYLKLSYSPEFIVTGRHTFDIIYPDQALEDLKYCKKRKNTLD